MPAEPLLAALAVAREHGLPTESPRILRDLTNVLVHLAPAPVVARVPLTLARLRDLEWFAAELELASFLAGAGAPAASPAPGLDPGPHVYDGRLVTFWTLVDHDPDRFDPIAAGASLRELHRALEHYEGTLPRFDRLDEVGRLLCLLEPSSLVSAEELAALRTVHGLLARESLADGRPLHGDAHFRNVLWTRDGPLWSDLENACSGPVEYDLACLTWRDAPGTREALGAYGPYDEALIARVEPFLALFLAAWTVVVVERVPTAGGREELRRRIDRACAYAREM